MCGVNGEELPEFPLLVSSDSEKNWLLKTAATVDVGRNINVITAIVFMIFESTCRILESSCVTRLKL